MKIYKLTKDGTTYHTGSEDGCFIKLQKVQSHSSTWAIEHEGWKIEAHEVSKEEGEKIYDADPYSYSLVTLKEDSRGFMNHTLKVEYKGRECRIRTQGARMGAGAKAGDKVQVMNNCIM